MGGADFEGWLLLGSFPDPDDDGVGSWLLHHGGQAVLLEVPPGLTVAVVRAGLARVGATLTGVTASHSHEDHLDPGVWRALRRAFPDAEFARPSLFGDDTEWRVGGEPLWIVPAPKHSGDDAVAVFRGVAMTGDIELGTLASVNAEVPARRKRKSMAHLRDFPARTGYAVHSAVSAHRNDRRVGVDWPTLFDC